jgi:hypothetical protein
MHMDTVLTRTKTGVLPVFVYKVLPENFFCPFVYLPFPWLLLHWATSELNGCDRDDGLDC